jgi:hypothetical protein
MTNVQAGAYAIFAKTVVDPQGGGSAWTVVCTLDAGGGNTDSAEFKFDSNVDHNSTLNMQVTRVFPSTGTIVLSCRSSDTATAHTAKIIAIKVDSVSREAVSG